MNSALAQSAIAICEEQTTTGVCPICGGRDSYPWIQTPDRFYQREAVYRLVRCPDCSLVWLQNSPEPSEMAAHYGSQYHTGVTEAGERNPSSRWKEHRSVVRTFATSGKMLDIGCSSGAFLRTMKDDRWDLCGIEIDPEVADRARKTTGAEVFVGDAPDAPFPPESFDVITCFHVLEHQYRPIELVAKAWQWLKPGGFFYVVVPNIDSWEARLFRSYWYGLEAPRHLSHFSQSSLCRIGEVAGFRLERMVTRADCHVEPSVVYLLNEVRRRFQVPCISVADGHTPALAWRIVRKAFRLTVLSPFRYAAAVSGNGASVSAVFKKTTI
jgi:SAM-dependent methyltransferase